MYNSKMENLLMDKKNMLISPDEVDLESLERGYKKCYRELCEWTKDGFINKGNKKIELLFNENGEFVGHVWDSNCQYSLEDLKSNENYELEHARDTAFELNELYGYLAEWCQEVREGL